MQASEPATAVVDPPTHIDLTDYLTRPEELAKQEATRRENEIARLNTERQRVANTSHTFAQERAKKAKLLEQVQAEGLDTAALSGKISEIDAQISEEDSKLAELDRQINELKPIAAQDWSRPRILASVLTNVAHCKSAIQVGSVQECYPHFAIYIASDDAGHPIGVEIAIGPDMTWELKVKGGESRYMPGYFPEALSWLPDSLVGAHIKRVTETRRPKCNFLAFIEAPAGRLLLCETKFEWRTREGKESKGDFGDIALSLDDHVDDLLGDAEEINLDDASPANELIDYLKRYVLDNTTATARFTSRKGYLPSKDIHAQIATDWSCLTSCPWTQQIKQTFALLKYYVENGERARFWSLPFDNNFGFRLRTRDHTWLVGEVYIDPSAVLPKVLGEPVFHVTGENYRQRLVLAVGRMYLRVEIES